MNGIVGILGFGAAGLACCALPGPGSVIAWLGVVSIASVLWLGNVEGVAGPAAIATAFFGFRRMAARAKSGARCCRCTLGAHAADARSIQTARQA